MSSPNAWLTPDDAPTPAKCWRVSVPGGDEWEAVFRGAMALLAMSSNWEQFGSLTPEECAQYFLDENFLTFEMRPCMAVGGVYFFAGTSAPDGSLVCDGGSYATADYPVLFDAIGYAWGGSGASFSVPDMRERFAIGSGVGVAVGDTGGEKNHTLTEAEMPSHSHPLLATIVPSNPVGPTPTLAWSAVATLATSSTGGDAAHNNLPPYGGLLPCIVAE